MNLFNTKNSINQQFAVYHDGAVTCDIKREDLLHAQVSGNKLRKLKYNLLAAKEQGRELLITFGGAYSNHIAATAAAGKLNGFKTLGIIRGEELGWNLQNTFAENSTLATAAANGMQFKFISRNAYRDKDQLHYLFALNHEFSNAYIIPEGGTNALAVQGTQEIITDYDRENYDVLCVAAGTGGTAAGIVNSAAAHQRVIVFSALKGNFMFNEICKYTTRTHFEVIDETTFGGYAKSNNQLIDFMNARFRESVTPANPKGIPLDPIYTAKMMYGIEQLVQSGVITGKTRILAVHTGGIQSIAGYNKMLLNKGRHTIDYV